VKEASVWTVKESPHNRLEIARAHLFPKFNVVHDINLDEHKIRTQLWIFIW